MILSLPFDSSISETRPSYPANGPSIICTASLIVKSFLNLAFKEIQKQPKQEELPKVICDKAIYDKQGCFYQEINPLIDSQIWNYAGMNEKEIQPLTSFASQIKITVINTYNYTFYFSFSENQ